jgi:hypothetical protein
MLPRYQVANMIPTATVITAVHNQPIARSRRPSVNPPNQRSWPGSEVGNPAPGRQCKRLVRSPCTADSGAV